MKKVLIAEDSSSWLVFQENNVNDAFTELENNDYEITSVTSATDGCDCIIENNDEPFDLIITDLQMEEDFAPKYAGEWLIEQIKTFKNYDNTKIVICSGSYNIKQIAESYSVYYMPKRQAISDVESYKSMLVNLLR